MHRPTDHQCLADARRRLADHLSLHVTDRSAWERTRIALEARVGYYAARIEQRRIAREAA